MAGDDGSDGLPPAFAAGKVGARKYIGRENKCQMMFATELQPFFYYLCNKEEKKIWQQKKKKRKV